MYMKNDIKYVVNYKKKMFYVIKSK